VRYSLCVCKVKLSCNDMQTPRVMFVVAATRASQASRPLPPFEAPDHNEDIKIHERNYGTKQCDVI
jgi:hypothetical protein